MGYKERDLHWKEITVNGAKASYENMNYDVRITQVDRLSIQEGEFLTRKNALTRVITVH